MPNGFFVQPDDGENGEEEEKEKGNRRPENARGEALPPRVVAPRL